MASLRQCHPLVLCSLLYRLKNFSHFIFSFPVIILYSSIRSPRSRRIYSVVKLKAFVVFFHMVASSNLHHLCGSTLHFLQMFYVPFQVYGLHDFTAYSSLFHGLTKLLWIIKNLFCMNSLWIVCVSYRALNNIKGRLHQHHLTFKSRLIPPLISTLRKLRFTNSTLPLIVT